MQTGIAVMDLHYPHHNKKLWNNILQLIGDIKPDIFILGGDNMNMDAVDHWRHEAGQRKTLEGARLKKEYEGFMKDILNPLEDALLVDTRKIFMYGNHEDWVEQYIDRNPEVEGLLEVDKNLPLVDWELYTYGKTVNTGKLLWHHGEYYNDNHTKKTVQTYFKNIAFGHTHTYQAYTKITPNNAEAHSAIALPCACDLNPDYNKDKSNRWLNGLAVFYVHDNGNFNLYPIIATKGGFIFNGKQYGI